MRIIPESVEYREEKIFCHQLSKADIKDFRFRLNFFDFLIVPQNFALECRLREIIGEISTIMGCFFFR